MSKTYRIHHIERAIYAPDGTRFEPSTRAWTPGNGAPRGKPANAIEAVTWLQRDSGHPARVPVAVIGAQPASGTEYAAAQSLGRALARMGLPVVTGPGGGVAEAVCKGATDAGGTAIVLLPAGDDATPNDDASLVLATGSIDVAPMLAQTSLCVIGVGERVGTRAEAAAALAAGRLLLVLEAPDDVPGARKVATVDDALALVAACALGERPDDEDQGAA